MPRPAPGARLLTCTDQGESPEDHLCIQVLESAQNVLSGEGKKFPSSIRMQLHFSFLQQNRDAPAQDGLGTDVPKALAVPRLSGFPLPIGHVFSMLYDGWASLL